VNTTGWLRGLEVTADGTGIVSHAGVALLRALSDNIGLTAGLSKALASRRLLVHDRGRVMADLACAIADGAEQNSVGLQARGQRLFRQGLAVGLDGGAADAMLLKAKFITADVGNRLQHSYRLFGDFGANAIAGQYGNAQLHTGRISCEPCASRMPARCAYSMAMRSCS